MALTHEFERTWRQNDVAALACALDKAADGVATAVGHAAETARGAASTRQAAVLHALEAALPAWVADVAKTFGTTLTSCLCTACY
jgi:hypothetical protein